MTCTKLCVVATHPIQYIAPWFRQLANDPRLTVEVIYFRELTPAQQGVGFASAFSWDVSLRDGYTSHVLGVPTGWKSASSLLWKLRALLMRLRPHVVLVTGWNEPGLLCAAPLIRCLGIPLVMRGESNAIRHRSAAKRFIHSLLLRCASAVVEIGAANRRFYLQNGVSPSQIFPGAYFVETDRMLSMASSHQAERASLRRSFGFENDDFVFAFVGKHVPFKRPDLLIEAAAIARSSHKGIKLIIAGSGEMTESLRAKAEARDVPVHFTGFLNQTQLWMAYVPADAFVLPSTARETWGLVTNEAMLFGLPVIVSDQVGCAADLVVAGETGHTFSGGAQSLARVMLDLASHPTAAAQMGRKARDRVAKHYSMDVATRGLVQAIETVARARV